MAVAFDSTGIFRRVIEPEAGTMPPELARYVMTLDFTPEDHARYEDLSARAQDGTLSAEEASELEGFLHVDSLLAIMRLKGKKSLGR